MKSPQWKLRLVWEAQKEINREKGYVYRQLTHGRHTISKMRSHYWSDWMFKLKLFSSCCSFQTTGIKFQHTNKNPRMANDTLVGKGHPHSSFVIFISYLQFAFYFIFMIYVIKLNNTSMKIKGISQWNY